MKFVYFVRKYKSWIGDDPFSIPTVHSFIRHHGVKIEVLQTYRYGNKQEGEKIPIVAIQLSKMKYNEGHDANSILIFQIALR